MSTLSRLSEALHEATTLCSDEVSELTCWFKRERGLQVVVSTDSHALVGDLDAELGNEGDFLACTRTSLEVPANDALAVSVEVTAE